MKYLLRWLLFSLALVPLLVNFDTVFPFIFTKTLLIRSVITFFWILFAVWFFTRREEAKLAIERNWKFVKSPLYISVVVFILIVVLGTIFAVNPYRSFFGDVERGEGLLGIIHFFSFFVAALLVFEKEDWFTFFRFNLITGAILFVDSVGELVSGEFVRAQSFVGNPTFLAGYFIFVAFCAMVVFPQYIKRKSWAWRYFSLLMIPVGIVGVFLTGTRGAILGLLVSALFVTLYFSLMGRDLVISFPRGRISAQKIGIALMALGIIGSCVFVLTIRSHLWQDIPGVKRFTDLSLDDSTLQTRLISIGVSIRSINPLHNDLHRFLIGYGQDNFNIAYNRYFNPEYLKYENLWFDRAHNKLLDVLVMNGVLGFIAYIGIWFFLFRMAFRKIKEKQYAVPIIFFGSAYFVQNLFVFDQISTWIPFFAFLAFAVFIGHEQSVATDNGKLIRSTRAVSEKLLPYKLPLVAAFFSFSLVMYAFVPYFQSITFVKSLQSGNVQVVLDSVKRFSEPYNYAQSTIRNRFLTIASFNTENPQALGLINEAALLQREYFEKEPYDPRDSTLLGGVYQAGGNLGEQGAYDVAEKYYLKSLELSPTRPEHLYNLANLAADRGKIQEMREYIDQMLRLAPDVARVKIYYGTTIFREGPQRYRETVDVLNSSIDGIRGQLGRGQEIEVMRGIYDACIKYFYEKRDEDGFLASAEGAKRLEEKIEEINLGRFNSGEIDSIPEERSAIFQDYINQFQNISWDGVAISQ